MANRYFVDELPAPGPHRLDGDLAHHLGRVLRAQPGDQVRLADGRGHSALAAVVRVGKHDVQVEVAPAEHEPGPELRLLLAFGVVRGPRTDWLLEHGTEVGVAAFQPLWTARTRPSGERPDRWQRIVRAAAGQCDRSLLPQVLPALELGAYLAGALPARRLLASESGTAVTRSDADAGEVALLVGPEGGFDAPELAAIAAAGFAARRLGPHILRTETAALCGAAVLLARSVEGPGQS